MKTVMIALQSNNQSGFLIKEITAMLFLASALCVTSCAPTTHKYSLAPPPPTSVSIGSERPLNAVFTSADFARIETASGFPAVESPEALGLKPTAVEEDCSVKDRFDRKYAVSYQWGRGGQNKIGLDVDGIGFGNSQLDSLKVEYSLRLQDVAPRKERCRYKSSWQGMMPSAYHEMFVREENTVWKEMRKFVDDADSRMDTLFDD